MSYSIPIARKRCGISEVINKLQEIQEEHGDLEVKAYDAIYFPIDEDTFLVHNNELLIRG